MEIIRTEDLAAARLLDQLLTVKETVAIYGVARLLKEKEPAAEVPRQPVEGAVWPVTDEYESEALNLQANWS